MGIEMVRKGVVEGLERMIDRKNALQGYLARNVYRRYQKAQMERFKTEGASEGPTWKPLSPKYAARKKIIYGGGPKHKFVGGSGEGRPWEPDGNWPSYPGKGTKMLIATGRLQKSVIGQELKDHRVLVTGSKIEVSSTVPYGGYVEETRMVMSELSQETTDEMLEGIMKFLVGEVVS
jgi:hypothetical protein